MSKILVLFAHPKYEKSRVNKALVERIRNMKDLTFHDLYEHYPDFNIDVDHEKDLLTNHQLVVWHHPFYWYSCPPLLKQWIDLVLEYRWAYGPGGNALEGKKVMSVITAGGSRQVYCAEGRNNYSVNEFLRPFEQTAKLCKMTYLPPFTVMGTHGLSPEDLEQHCDQYEQALTILKEGLNISEVGNCNYFNDLPQINKLKVQ